jgi:hypothetical protein
VELHLGLAMAFAFVDGEFTPLTEQQVCKDLICLLDLQLMAILSLHFQHK